MTLPHEQLTRALTHALNEYAGEARPFHTALPGNRPALHAARQRVYDAMQAVHEQIEKDTQAWLTMEVTEDE